MEFKGDRLLGDKGQNPFSIPPGYFEELPLEIQNRISEGNHSKKGFGVLTILKHQMAVSLGVLIFVGVAYTGYKYNENMDKAVIQADDYFEFVSNNAGQFNEQDLIKVLNIEKRVASKKNLKKESDKIIEYLVSQQLDIAAVEAILNEQKNEIN